MILWLLFIGLAFGYLYTAILSVSAPFPLVGQQSEQWALFIGDTAIPLASLFALALIALLVHMRKRLGKA